MNLDKKSDLVWYSFFQIFPIHSTLNLQAFIFERQNSHKRFYQSVASEPTFGHLWGDSLSHLMLIIAHYSLIRVNDFILYGLKVIENFVIRLAFKAWASASVGFGTETFKYRLYCTVPLCPRLNKHLNAWFSAWEIS